jgi:gephyrin
MLLSTVHARNRISPYPQISLDDALKTIVSEIKPLGVVSLPVSEG